MNLTKLFNFKYLKENLRKSRGILFLICILVPVFTTLPILLNIDRAEVARVATQFDISIINIFGMFFIPVIISYILFGYVFKKNSVDLINSMPLKRSTIFVTNTVGGIVIITLIQVITAVLLLLCSFFSKSYIFPAMIWDIFLLMWLAYIFVFVASNVAMSVSGTFLTQCAVTLLIIFLVPFCVSSFNRFDERSKIIIRDNGEKITQYVNSNSNYRVFTAPSSIIYNGLRNGRIYTSESLVRTALLSVVYIIIGLKLFEKRKMENAEESFESYKIHLFIKALTMVPMVVFIHYISEYDGTSIILYALVIFYYFIYDFIVKKKIQLKYSIPILFVVLFCLSGICSFSDFVYDKFELENVYLDKKDIKGIAIDFGSTYGYYENNNNSIYTSDKELIDIVLELEKNRNSLDSNIVLNHGISIKLKTKNNKEANFSMGVSSEELNTIAEIIDKGYINELKKYYTQDGIIRYEAYLIDDYKVSKDIDDELKFLINNMTAKQFIEFKENNNHCLIKENYRNHGLALNLFSMDSSKNILELFAEYENKKTVDILKNVRDEELDSWYYGISIDNNLKNFESKSIDTEYGNYYFNYYQDDVIRYIINNKDNKFDSSKEYYLIRGNYNLGRNFFVFFYFTNDIEQLNEIVAKDVAQVDEENKEYYVEEYLNEEVVENVENNSEV